VALGIEISQLTPLYPHKVFLQWDLTSPTESGSYTFTIERSGSVEGPWEILQAGAQNSYNYIDDMRTQAAHPEDGKPHLYSLQRQFYYRVTVIPPSGCTNQAVTAPHGVHKTSLSPVQAGVRRRLQYDERILYQRFNGVRLVLLKRRHWGTRCPDCYDPTTRAVTKEHCLVCYGTGFAEGYWNPVTTYGRVYPPDNINAQTTARDKKEASQHLLTLLDVPRLQDGDIIIEVDTNHRHVVRTQKQTELRRKAVHQQVTTSLVDHGSIEYQIPVDERAAPPLL
jgi:hypothetical protein